MDIPLINKTLDWFFRILERFAKIKYWAPLSAILIAALCWGYFYPKYKSLKSFTKPGSDTLSPDRRVMKIQINNPLTVLPDFGESQEKSHPGKMQYRLAMPVIGHIFSLNFAQLLYFQNLVGILFFLIIILLVYRSTHDKVAALLLALALAFSYTGSSFYIDGTPFYDGIAYFCLASAMIFKNPILVFLSVFVACWTDERAVIASSLIVVWWQVNKKGVSPSFKDLFSLSTQSIAIIAAWIIYFAGRYILTTRFGFYVQSKGMFSPEVITAHKFHIFWGLFAGFRWLWLVIFLGFAWLIKDKNYPLATALLFLTLILTATSGIVYDHLRSVAYMFPLIIIFLYIWGTTNEKRINLRYLLLGIMALCFLMSPLKYMLGLSSFMGQ